MISNTELAYYTKELISWEFELELIHSDLIQVINSNMSTLNHSIFLVNDTGNFRIHANLNSYTPGSIFINKVVDNYEVILVNIPLIRNEDYMLFISLFDKFIELAFEFINNSEDPFTESDYKFMYNKLLKESNERQNKLEKINK